MTVLDADRVLWISGAGSGMGRAVAVAAAAQGAKIALSGRRAGALAETAAQVEAAGGQALVLPLDARDPAGVAEARTRIATTWGGVSDLVLAAGLNAPERYWADQSMTDVEAIFATNLTGAVRMIDAGLPDLRTRGSGHVVVVSSYAAWRFSPAAGVAYSASKAALASICATVNAQEAAHGIRACHLCPGDVDTDFLTFRPEVPDAESRQAMLTPADVAASVLFVLGSPDHVRIDELVISPLSQV